MFKPVDPAQAYRKVQLDACVAGSRPRDLVRLCIDDVAAALAQSLWADVNDRPDIRRRALARAQNGLSALRLGVDQSNDLGPALLTFYEAMSHSLRASQVRFDRTAVEGVARDVDDVARAILT